MRPLQTFILLAAALAPLSGAETSSGPETCFTRFGSVAAQQVSTHTTSQTILMTLVSKKTKHPGTTVTPTSTVTVESIVIDTITLARNTDTITSTAIATTTSILVVDVSQTNTVELTGTTVEAPTVTLGTAANFTPFASEAAVVAAGGGATYPGVSKKRREALRRPRRGLGDLAPRPQAVKRLMSGQRYPRKVECVGYVDDIVTHTTTITAGNTITHTAPPSIVTTTLVATVTSTVVPGDASTTITTTSTATSFTVSVNVGLTTVTSTTTSTSYAGAVVTSYAQCQSNNLITYVGGKPLFAINGTDNTILSTPDAATCCQTCANTVGCAGFSGPTPGFTDCYIFLDSGTCDASHAYWTTYLAAGETSDFSVIGNGDCGQAAYGGQGM